MKLCEFSQHQSLRSVHPFVRMYIFVVCSCLCSVGDWCRLCAAVAAVEKIPPSPIFVVVAVVVVVVLFVLCILAAGFYCIY